MIISLVSKYERAGKSNAASVLDKLNMYKTSFASALNSAALAFMPTAIDKYEVNDEIGVSLKELNHIISDAVHKRNPEIAVWWVKKTIEDCVSSGISVVIDDTRRLREFVWLDALARKHGTEHVIIEIVPVGEMLEKARLDTWTNGIEPCGYEAFKDMSRIGIINDGTEEFDKKIIELLKKH